MIIKYTMTTNIGLRFASQTLRGLCLCVAITRQFYLALATVYEYFGVVSLSSISILLAFLVSPYSYPFHRLALLSGVPSSSAPHRCGELSIYSISPLDRRS